MTLPLHLLEDLALRSEGEVVELTGDEAHHAATVRRLAIGERLLLTDGRRCSATGVVSDVAKRSLHVELIAMERSPEQAPRLVVVQALPKGERGELAVELLTEIGVSEVIPWAASRCVAQWRGDRVEKGLLRWRKTAREAAKQSRRVWWPTVAALATTADVAQRIAAADLALVLHEGGAASWTAVPDLPSGEIVVVVGPEGGLTDEEVATLSAAGGLCVTLGDEVLRTSTAGLAGCAALLSRSPRWLRDHSSLSGHG